uniref:Uncharacterized protein n=1 Tax=Rhizophora mucronata TaxID=61149 RepID=A0A2P2QJ82_RHIMU
MTAPGTHIRLLAGALVLLLKWSWTLFPSSSLNGSMKHKIN